MNYFKIDEIYFLPYAHTAPEKFADELADNVEYMEPLVLQHAMVLQLQLKLQLPLALETLVLERKNNYYFSNLCDQYTTFVRAKSSIENCEMRNNKLH